MPLFTEIAKASDSRRRQLAAQAFMLFWHVRNETRFVDIKSRNIDEFYHEHVGFDEDSFDAKRFQTICMVLQDALYGQPKLVGHYLIHSVLLADMLRSEYAQGWASHLGSKLHEFDRRRDEAVKAEKTGAMTEHARYYAEYGRWTQTQADIGSNIRRRHAFFVEEMLKMLAPKKLDPKAAFSELERKIVFFRDREECQWCRMYEDSHKVSWQDCEIHHVLPHGRGGATELNNAALVHRDCHPKSDSDVERFGLWWRERRGREVPETEHPFATRGELPQDGTQAKFDFGGKPHMAVVRDRQLVLLGEHEGAVCGTFSAASVVITGTQRNGWRDWHLLLPGEQDWVPATLWRQRIRKEGAVSERAPDPSPSRL